ncbi:MAG: family 2 glycosyl transferase [Alteromonadaceae bacterium]|nr:family 2 glycosyl transferase [Alteromonadaceae bacterium]MBH85726.1 family 2 glycosyl transferase [Alteromonadaceae bacterium]|tara:strand:+ start:206 stop:1192 length:987 start_codon:yes stop_codon:yes gene_type:complete
MTTVSVVSVFYNRSTLVGDTVKSLLDQDLTDYEVLLVDDGSKDDTLAQLNRYADDPRVRVIGGENMGFVNAINAAIDEAKGRYIAVHGSGDIAFRERLSRQSAVLDARPEVGVVGCRSEIVTLQSTRAPHITPFTFDGDAETEILTTNPFHHGEVMFRRDLFYKVGKYRSYFVCAQDRDLWCRLSHHTQFVVLNDVLYRKFAKVPGSVSADPRRLLLQRYLSDFAVFCHRERLAGRPDPLDKYGTQGGLFKPPSRELSKSLCTIGSRFAADGDLDNAKLFYLRSEQESGYLYARMMRIVAANAPFLLTGAGKLYRRIMRVFQKASFSK